MSNINENKNVIWTPIKCKYVIFRDFYDFFFLLNIFVKKPFFQ